ncbi:serine/threonine protein kinase [Anabaena sp. CCY 9910]|uniref:serine/threonine protein kinase n=1 Tax=Anabaena sp. CCY 9910 TaxID=3103870 RepID=UPI0039E0141D
MIWNPGDKLNRNQYEIIQELGRGRFAITYLAQKDGQEVVIKTLNPDELNQLSNEDRDHLESGFSNESLKLQKCQHPNIVRVIETFMQGGLLCMVMEYIQGNNLANIVQSRRFLPEQEALNYIQQIGQALIEVHRQGLLHRDVKPENIVVRAGTHKAILIDFDLARTVDNPLTSRGARVHGFTPIELYSNSRRQQARRGKWTDVYSLAATLYVLLTGKQPVSSIDRQDQNQRLIPPQELNPEISDRTNQAILHAMELEPDKRPQTVEEWLKELGLIKSAPILPQLPFRQPLWAWILEVMGVLALLAALISGFKDGWDLWKELFPDKPIIPTKVTKPNLPSPSPLENR